MHHRFIGVKSYVQSRFFPSSTSHHIMDARNWLPKDFTELPIRPHSKDVDELSLIQRTKMQEMQLKYDHLLKRRFQGQIAYTLTSHSPEKMIKTGGFKKSNPNLWLSNTGSGNNSGCVCFSLLPEVTAIFNRHDHRKPNFIYAVVLQHEYILTGSKWREIISPGAFPISRDSFFVARQLLGIKANGQLELGPIVGRRGNNSLMIHGERFDKFCLNQLILPKEINQGDDYPPEFNILDTPTTAELQKEVENYYRTISSFYPTIRSI